MIDEQEILKEVEAEIEEMDEATLEEEARKAIEAAERRKQYRSSSTKTPEQLEKQRLYRKKKYQRDKLLIAKYKELHPEEFE